MSFHIIRNDITKMHVDAIVNSANPEPTYAYGTDLAIYTAAGASGLLAERQKIGVIKPGDAAVTSAGNLPAKHVIHTVGPSWVDGDSGEFEVLRSCYENSLLLAHALGCKSIAFPLIATGVYAFPKDKALQIAMNTIQTFLFSYEMDVFLVVFDEKAFVLSGKIFDQIQAYVDASYVNEVEEAEYANQKDTNFANQINQSNESELRRKVLDELKDRADLFRSEYETEAGLSGKSNTDLQLDALRIDALVETDELTFQEKLLEYIDRSGLKPSLIYRPIEMSRQQFSKIQSNRQYKPKKNTAILLCIVLKLSLSETVDLLSRAGFALSPSNKQDLIVKACIQYGQYDFYVIDGMMQKNHVETLINYYGK